MVFGTDSSAEYCKKACAESLKVLGIDYIDLCKYSSSPSLNHMTAPGAKKMP